MDGIISELRINYSIKERIFIYYMFFFALMAAVTTGVNILNNLAFSFNYKWIAIAVFSTVLLVLSYKKIRIPLVHRIGAYVLVLILLPASGLSSAGLVSPGIMYSFLLLILINYLFTGCERVFLNIGTILINMALIILFRFYPDIFKHLTPREQFLDWITNVPVVSTFIVVLLIAFERAYETEREMNEQQAKMLKQLSLTDFLTGLYNRKHLEEKLEFLCDVFKRARAPFSVLMIDIDFFKEYNDRYGHLAGDECLKIMGSILKKRISRNTDWAYRFGGEEFLILLGFSDEKAAEIVAKQIQEDLALAGIVHETSKVDDLLTVSIGIASVHTACTDPKNILEQADKALYESKRNGRNMITVV